MKSAVSVLEEDIKAAFGMFDRVGDGTIGYRVPIPGGRTSAL
jgi:Ca2+-binding EF-hand superfamily protein